MSRCEKHFLFCLLLIVLAGLEAGCTTKSSDADAESGPEGVEETEGSDAFDLLADDTGPDDPGVSDRVEEGPGSDIVDEGEDCEDGSVVTAEIEHAMWLYPYIYEPWTGHYWYARHGHDGLGDYFEDPQIFIDYIEDMDIDTIMICGGVWQADGSIKYDTNKDETLDKHDMIALWADFIARVKAVYPRMKVLVWVSTINGVNTDLADAAKVQAMVRAARTMLTETPFDGWNEDYEGWTGDLEHLRTFYHEMAAMVKELGLIATVAAEVNWGTYAVEDYAYLLADFDYNMPMFYSGALHNNAAAWNRILEHSPCPVVMGISVWSSVFDTDSWEYLITFDEQIAWWTAREEENSTNLAGYCIWSFDQMSYEDMDSWAAWAASP